MKKITTLIFFFTLFCNFNVYCQLVADTSKVVLIETIDGNEYVGKILSDNTVTLILKTDNIGIITIQRINIKKIKEVKLEQIKDGTVWFENIQSTRYFWAPNGYGLKTGEGYYQNLWIFYNQAGYGFSDNFSVGVGLIPLFLFAGGSTPVWITPKFSIPIKKDEFNLGAGILAATVIGEDSASFGIAYGLTTFGSRDRNFTLGMGYGYVGKDWAKRPIVMASTMIRTGKRGYFMSENYYISTGDGYVILMTLGGRTLTRKIAIDYGLVIPIYTGMESLVAIPWLGLTVPIEGK
ncbi:MAG: hypothetical protein HOO91_07335 [Bacteroidales bacterium]|nr:hypothetical protein [Bacteroidales bacterium]